MAGYEDAPATKMLATNCACCGKELLDAQSVEVGLGPECRKKHRLPNTLTEEDREKANKLVYLIAMNQFGPEVDKAIAELKAIGCEKIVTRIQNRVYGKKRVVVTVREDPEATENRFNVASPYDEDFVYRVKRVRGRRWDGDNKVNHFPIESWDELWRIVSDCYDGRLLQVGEYERVIRRGDDLSREDIRLPAPNGNVEPEKPVTIKIERHDKWFAIYTPYDRKLVDEMRDVRGRRWSGRLRANLFPVEVEDDVSEMVQRYWPTATFEIVTVDKPKQAD